VDLSNTPAGTAILLPEDPDLSARTLQAQLSKAFGVPVAVIISDTFGRPWREGLVNVALGVAGVAPVLDYRGKFDGSGKKLQATVIAVADEIASAAELVMGKADRVPVVVVQDLRIAEHPGSGCDLIRSPETDLFR
jgi:coenzyme F420-0:L-glutamate ligase/coenzyme F420-1:gamma-L-glutamate ligase